MGGRIEVQSRYGAGSTFSLVLTAYEVAPNDLSTVEKNPGTLSGQTQAQRILVVDDNFINRKVASDLLRDLGYTPDLAKDGEQALEMIQRKTYDIVFTDLRMPSMDGYELVRRAQRFCPACLRFVAMTASATLEEKEKCWSQGIRSFICKPIQEQDLLDVLREQVSP